MTHHGDTPRVHWVEVDGERLPAWIADGQVRVELPFEVDFVALAEALRRDGYFYAHHPERVDAQGWGRDFDREGYYPYWVRREGRPPGRVVFACPPEDYRRPARPGEMPAGERRRRRRLTDDEVAAEMAPAIPAIGPAAVAEIRRWVPYLRRVAGRAPAGRPPAPGWES